MDALLTMLGIYFLCWFKFIAGPVLGSAAGYTVVESALVTIAGTMSSVMIFTLIGTQIRAFIQRNFRPKSKPIFTKKNRNIVHLWKKYGEMGIALFTPLFLTPIGGTLIMVSFGVKKRRIYTHMLWSSCLWAFILSSSIDQLMHISFIKGLFI
ncbi:hypothetical protein PBT90_15370 [Algoriphagus halophytocola]|uniref:Small multi-drug export protein n=1 Tax=Algoriphagus halophytocola TaxID=2991499 RepID=A0ABY6MEB7_9BACT|nr:MULTISPECIES: hypothetical protein [unclassified Algoriphagus]UZD20956.1 hypothetical protein OM944_09705 [Algoriphagus sp. TR-M5]WBL42122.1 hypothetical protein PBT90_15370 [Algoriphagus sp. TR-M9]